ncbi:MAG: hypothetical protein KAS32_21690 [Candidatus Peribacteraceae bacterium]|nr:hypothetical protein [Candidatus Peribacteraceae bacterium]
METETETPIFPPELKAIDGDKVKPNADGVLTLNGRIWEPLKITDLERFTEAWDASIKLHEDKEKRTRKRRETDGESYQRLSDMLTDFGANEK